MQAERTREFFHDYARDFDSIYGSRNGPVSTVINKLFRKSMQIRYDRTMAGASPIEGRTVLDVGSGPGHYSVELARRGAREVHGLDFADGMLDIARGRAESAGVGDRCRFEVGDFSKHDFQGKTYDYVVVMGFMDYMADPEAIVRKVMSLTKSKAFFSFPSGEGVLAWQRRMRYRSRCELYMYTPAQIERIFARIPNVSARVEPIARDYFVTATVKG